MKTKDTSIYLYQIPAHTHIKRKEEKDVVVKKATRTKKKRKVKKMGFQIYSRKICTKKSKKYYQANIRAKNPWAMRKNLVKKKISGKLYVICSKSTKKILKLHKSLCKVSSTLIVKIKTEKMDLKKFL